MSRDATGVHSAWAVEDIACPVCGAAKGVRCDLSVPGYAEHGTHWQRTEDAPPRDPATRALGEVVVSDAPKPRAMPAEREAEIRESLAAVVDPAEDISPTEAREWLREDVVTLLAELDAVRDRVRELTRERDAAREALAAVLAVPGDDRDAWVRDCLVRGFVPSKTIDPLRASLAEAKKEAEAIYARMAKLERTLSLYRGLATLWAPWDTLPEDAQDPNRGRECVCGVPIRQGCRYIHKCRPNPLAEALKSARAAYVCQICRRSIESAVDHAPGCIGATSSHGGRPL